jgi:peptidoglycan/LPS O-acetylase OafA/YrhL
MAFGDQKSAINQTVFEQGNSMTQQPQRHYGFIDGVRGIAACAVMLQHAFEQTGFLALEKGSFALSWLNLGEFGVVAFFFVSGFVIPLSLEKWGNIPHFWVNRVFRIYPLYLTVYFIAAILTGFAGLALSQIPKNLFFHLLFIQEFVRTPNFIGVAWTLSLEAVWYLLFTFLFYLGLNRRYKLVIVLAVAVALALCLVTLTVLRLPMGRVGLLLVCVLGLLCLRKEFGEIGNKLFLGGWSAISAIIIVGLFIGFWLRPGLSSITPSFRCVLISWALAFAFFMTAFLHRTWVVTNNRATRYLGKISYSIYLVHGFVIPGIVAAFARIHGGSLLTVFAIVAATIAISNLTYRYIEYPAIAFSHRLRPRKAG